MVFDVKGCMRNIVIIREILYIKKCSFIWSSVNFLRNWVTIVANHFVQLLITYGFCKAWFLNFEFLVNFRQFCGKKYWFSGPVPQKWRKLDKKDPRNQQKIQNSKIKLYRIKVIQDNSWICYSHEIFYPQKFVSVFCSCADCKYFWQ